MKQSLLQLKDMSKIHYKLKTNDCFMDFLKNISIVPLNKQNEYSILIRNIL